MTEFQGADALGVFRMLTWILIFSWGYYLGRKSWKWDGN